MAPGDQETADYGASRWLVLAYLLEERSELLGNVWLGLVFIAGVEEPS